jgi:hypothetical protein
MVEQNFPHVLTPDQRWRVEATLADMGGPCRWTA